MNKQRNARAKGPADHATGLPLYAVHPIRAGILRTFHFGAVLGGMLAASPAVYANPHPGAGVVPTGANIISVTGARNPANNTFGTASGCVATVCLLNSGSLTTITQSNNGIIINWNNFDIGQGGTVNFIQPSANSVAINYVNPSTLLGGDGMATGIFGSLTANGHIFVINPMGLVVGNGASINAGSVVLSALDLQDPTGANLLSQPGWDTPGQGVVSVPFISGSSGGSASSVTVADGASVTGTNGVFLLGNNLQVGAGGSGATISSTSGPVVLGAVDNGVLNLDTTPNMGDSTFTVTAGSSNLSGSTVEPINVGANSQITGNSIVVDALTNSLTGAAQIMNLDGVLNSASTVTVVANNAGSSTPGVEIGGQIITPTSGGAVSLTSTGPITQQAAAGITAQSLSGSSVNGAALTASNNDVAQLDGFSNTGSGDFLLTDASGLSVTGAVSSGSNNINLSTTGSGNGIALAAGLSGNTVTLDSAGAITEGAGGSVNANTLTGSSTGGAALGGQFANLGSFSNTGAGSLTVSDTGALAVTGPVSSTTLALNSGGAITETAGGSVTATTLTGSSNGGTALTGSGNQIGTLGSFNNTGTGAVAITDSQTLAVTGPVNAGSGNNLTLTTSSGGLGVNGALTGATVALDSAGAITEGAGGSVNASTLTGTSNGGAVLTGSGNQIGTLGSFTNTGTGAVAITDSKALAVSGPVNAGSGSTNNLTLTTTSGGLGVNGALTGATVALNSAGAITQGSGGSVNATTLTGSSNGGTTLSGQFGTLGNFSNTGAGNLSLSDAAALSVTGTVSSSNALNLTTTGSGHAMTLTGALSGTSVALTATGAISQTAGSIITPTLTGSSSGNVNLAATGNQIGTLGSFTAGNNFTLVDADSGGLTVSGPVTASNDAAITNSAGNLTINGAVEGDVALALSSGGSMSEGTGGSLTTQTLSGTSVGGAQLTSATNSVQRLGNWTNTGSGNFAFSSDRSLAVNGNVNVGAANNATIQTVGTNHSMTVNGTVLGNTVELDATGTVAEGTAGVINAAVLQGSSTGGLALTSAGNIIASLGNLSNSGTGVLSVSDSTALAVNGAVNSVGTLTLASGGALSEGAGGGLIAPVFTGTSVGGASLTGSGNQITSLGSFTNTGTGNVAFTNAQTLAVTGPVSAGTGNNLTLGTSAGDLGINGALTGSIVGLNAAGGVSEGTGGSITAATLTGGATTGVALGGNNQVTALGAFSNIGTGDLALTNANALTVTGPVSSSNGLTLTTTGSNNLTLNGTVSGANVALNAGGSLGEGSAGGITAGTFTGTSTGGAALTAGTNQIGNLGNFSNAGTGAVALTNGNSLIVNGTVNAGSGNALTLTASGGDLDVTGSVTGQAVTLASGANLGVNGGINGSNVTLNSGGAVSENAGGAINAGTLTATSNGGAALNQGSNQIGTLAGLTNTGNGAVAVSSGQTMTVSGPVNAGIGNTLTLGTTGTGSNLMVNGALTGSTVALDSSGTLAEGSGGAVNASTVTGSSTGGATLTGSGNQFSSLGGFTNSGTGNVAIADSQAMTITGTVAAGAGNALALNSGGAITGMTTGGPDVSGDALMLTTPTGSNASLSAAVNTLSANVGGNLTLTLAQPVTSVNNVNVGGNATFNVPGNFTLTGTGSGSGPNVTAQNITFDVGSGSTVGPTTGIGLLSAPRIVVVPNGDPVLNFGSSVSVLSLKPGSGVVTLKSIGGTGANNVTFFANVEGPGGTSLGNSAIQTDGTVSFSGGQSLTLGDTLTRLDAIQQSFTRLVVPDLSGGEEFVRTSTDSMTPPPEADTSSRNEVEPQPADTDLAAGR